MDPKRLVGAPRFELGTPCTPCKCATRLRHAPTRLFLLKSGWGLAARNFNDTPFVGRRRSAPQHLHQLLELDPHLPDNLLALRNVGARLFAGQLVARPAYGEALVV